MLLTLLSSFGQTFFISIFAGEIRAEFGLSHGDWGLIYMIATTASAIVMVWAGRQADVFRIRTLGALSLASLAVTCLAMAFNSLVLILPVIIFALRLSGQGMMSHVAAVAMARWFKANRGRALSIAAMGFAVGQAFAPMLVVGLMVWMDWRVIWILCAGVAMAFVPVLMFLLRSERTPASMAQETSALGMKGKHWSRMDMVRHPLFWFMIPALLGPSAFNTAFFFHQVHYSDVIGISNFVFVSYLPLFTAISVVMTLISGAALDRFGTARLLPLHQTPMIIAFGLFAYASGGGITLGMGFAFMALTAGATATLPSAFWAEFYGTAHLGAIKALAAAVMVMGSAIGPGLTGALIDFGAGIQVQYGFVALYFVLTSAMMWIGVRLAKRDI